MQQQIGYLYEATISNNSRFLIYNAIFKICACLRFVRQKMPIAMRMNEMRRNDDSQRTNARIKKNKKPF